jgi:hypothetical protein
MILFLAFEVKEAMQINSGLALKFFHFVADLAQLLY